MGNLVQRNENGQVVTTSLLVAEKFGKQHRHVLEAIKTLVENSADVPKITEMFAESTYLDCYNREQRRYLMNRDGFSLLVMSFTGKEALKFKVDFINAFNSMESILKEIAHSELLKDRKRMNILKEKSNEVLNIDKTINVMKKRRRFLIQEINSVIRTDPAQMDFPLDSMKQIFANSIRNKG